MRIITFQPVMDGKLRTATPKSKVNGWTHTCSVFNIHYFRRGRIGYILDTDEEGRATLEKFDYTTGKYVDVDYDEFYKFYDIKSE